MFGRCLQVRCNADSACTNRLPLCINGSCQSPSCSADSDCARGGCVGGHCEKVECTTNAACPSGRSCVDHHCRDCVTDAQCGSTGVCRSNSCVCVECKGAQQCAVDQKCNSENNCVPFCEEGRIFVSGSDGNRICKTCVNPNTAKRCNEFPGCGRNTFCAKVSASIAAVSIHRILMVSWTISATFATFPIPMAFPTVRTATRSSISPAYARCWSGAGSTNPSASASCRAPGSRSPISERSSRIRVHGLQCRSTRSPSSKAS